MVYYVSVILVLLGVSDSLSLAIRNGHGHDHDHYNHDSGTSCPDTQNGIHVDTLHWNDLLCLEVLLIDCLTYVAQHDEKICATNGVEYSDHCHFMQARCTALSTGYHIEVANHGACAVTTHSPPSTVAPTTTGNPNTDATATHAPVAVTHTTPKITTTPTTQAVTTTENPVHSIMQNVFCQSVGSIDCPKMAIDVICGTDGNVYPNNCEFSKSKCQNATLRQQDISYCLIGQSP